MRKILLLGVVALSCMAMVKPSKRELVVRVPPSMFSAIHVVKASMSEYVNVYLYSDSIVRGYVFTGTTVFQPFSYGGRKIIDIAPGFNTFLTIDDQGYAWQGDLSSPSSPVRVSTDTFGNSFNQNAKIYGYFFSYMTISTDSTTIWYWGTDSYNFYGLTGGNAIKKPVRLHAPGGKKWVKLAGGNNLLGLTSAGEIYQWNNGDSNYVVKTLPAGGVAIDIAGSHNDFYMAVIHDYAGGNANLGSLYWWGSQQGFIGDNNSRTQPFALTSIFKDSVGGALPFHIKNVVTNDNTVHFVDSVNDEYGEGDGAQAEVGQGKDTVIKYQYSNQYAWTTIKGEGYTNGTCYKVLTNVKLMITGTSFTFYCMATDQNDSLWFWGRNKSFVLPTRYVNNTESTKPNALDIVRPVIGNGLSNPTAVAVNFVGPTASAGSNQTVTTNNPTVTLSGSATQMGAYGYSFASQRWTLVSGSATINSPTATSTTLTFASAGSARVRVTTTDTQTATDTASVLITYNPPAGGCGGCTVMKQYRQFRRG